MSFCRQFVHGSFFLILSVVFFAGYSDAQTSNEKIKKELQFIELGNPKQALNDLKLMASAEQKNAEVHAALALAMMETDNVSGASKEVDIAFDQERKNVLVRIARGVLFGKQGKRGDAVSEFNQAIKINEKDVAPLLYLARFYLSVDSLKPAEIILYRAQSVNGNDVRPFLGLAELYEKQHILDLAIEQYSEAKKLDPKDITVIARLAGLYFRVRQYNDAIKEWDNLTKVDPNYARAYYEMAHIYDISEDHINAAKYAEKYVALDPDNLDGIWLLARSYAESNQYQKALPLLERASKIDSLKGRTDLYLARSYFFQKDYTKANQLYSGSKDLNAYDLYYYGYSLVSSGDTNAGLEKWKLELKADSSGRAEEKLHVRNQIISYLNIQKKYGEIGDIYTGVAQLKHTADDYASAGQFYMAASAPDKAQAAFEAALKLDPKLIKAHLGIADLMGRSPDKLADAEKMIDGAVAFAVTPDDKELIGNGYARLGIQFYTAKDYEGCAKIMEDKSLKYLTSKSPFLINVYKVLGATELQLKNYKKSMEYYKKAQEISPEDEDVKKGMDYIKQVQGK